MLLYIEQILGNGLDPCDVNFQSTRELMDLDVKHYYTVGNVKALLEKKYPELDRSKQRLFFDGRPLEDSETLESHHIKHKSTLPLFMITGEKIDYTKPKWFA